MGSSREVPDGWGFLRVRRKYGGSLIKTNSFDNCSNLYYTIGIVAIVLGSPELPLYDDPHHLQSVGKSTMPSVGP